MEHSRRQFLGLAGFAAGHMASRAIFGQVIEEGIPDLDTSPQDMRTFMFSTSPQLALGGYSVPFSYNPRWNPAMEPGVTSWGDYIRTRPAQLHAHPTIGMFHAQYEQEGLEPRVFVLEKQPDGKAPIEVFVQDDSYQCIGAMHPGAILLTHEQLGWDESANPQRQFYERGSRQYDLVSGQPQNIGTHTYPWCPTTMADGEMIFTNSPAGNRTYACGADPAGSWHAIAITAQMHGPFNISTEQGRMLARERLGTYPAGFDPIATDWYGSLAQQAADGSRVVAAQLVMLEQQWGLEFDVQLGYVSLAREFYFQERLVLDDGSITGLGRVGWRVDERVDEHGNLHIYNPLVPQRQAMLVGAQHIPSEVDVPHNVPCEPGSDIYAKRKSIAIPRRSEALPGAVLRGARGKTLRRLSLAMR